MLPIRFTLKTMCLDNHLAYFFWLPTNFILVAEFTNLINM